MGGAPSPPQTPLAGAPKIARAIGETPLSREMPQAARSEFSFFLKKCFLFSQLDLWPSYKTENLDFRRKYCGPPVGEREQVLGKTNVIGKHKQREKLPPELGPCTPST